MRSLGHAPHGPPAEDCPDGSSGRSARDALPCSWLRLDGHGRITDVNAETERQTGRTRAELIGKTFDELLTLPSRVVYQTYLLPLMQFNADTAELGLVLRATQSGPPLDVLFYSRRSADDAVDVLLSAIRQRRRIEDELVRIKRAADQAPLMVFQMLAEDGVPKSFPYASQRVRDLYHCTPEQAATSAEAVFGWLDADTRTLLERALSVDDSGEPARCHVHYTLPPRDGAAPRTHELVAVSRSLGSGRVLWHGYVADATDRLRLEREAAERSAAEESARLRKAFLDRASHELRTPLNAILGFAQLLGKDAADALRPEHRQALSVLESAGRHLLSLVNRLLDLSRVETLGAPMPLRPLALLPELQALQQAMQAQATAAGVELRPLAAACDCVALAEPVVLRQLLTNLLSNAIKYTCRGGWVEIVCSEAGPRLVRISVVDNGAGLDDKQRQHLFEPFNRLGAERTATEGTGLGLVLARQLARALGSDIEVDSAPGRGSCFTFALVRDAAGALNAPGPPPLPQVHRDSPPPATGTVWYVEDNEVNVLLMQAIASRRPGIVLQVATHGAAAEALADDAMLTAPSLLLLDMQLPDTDGRQLLARLRGCPALARVPAVLVTAAAEEHWRATAAPGFEDFTECWIKPLDVDATLAAFDRLLAPQRAGR